MAVVDETGKVLDTSVIFPVPPKPDIEGSKRIIKALLEKHDVDVISTIFISSASGSCSLLAIEIAERFVKSRSGNSSTARVTSF